LRIIIFIFSDYQPFFNCETSVKYIYMGSIDLKKIGALSGKIGPLIAYVTNDGKQAFRTYTKPVDPQTPKQMANRMKLGLVNKSLAPLCKVIKQGYPDEPNAYRKLVGKACREAVEGEYPNLRFNYSKIHITRGMLQLPSQVHREYHPDTHELHFTWDAILTWASLPGNYQDKVTIVCLHAGEQPEVIIHHAGTRDDGRATLRLPEGWQVEQTHSWLYLTSYNKQLHSTSIYIT
jgi:hypothetical protein